MPGRMLRAYLDALPALQAEYELLLASAVGLALGGRDARREIERLRGLAAWGIGERKTAAPSPAELEMIGIRVVKHGKSG